MLERLITKQDLERNRRAKTLPRAVTKRIEETLEILDENYGEDRSIRGGGYVIIATKPKALKKVSHEDHIDFDTDIFEYIDSFHMKYTSDWIEATLIKSNDYGIRLYMPIGLITNNMKKYLIKEENQ